MKKILLTMMLVLSIAIVNAQALLNEVYTDPNVNGNHSEFFELYNIAPVGEASQNLNCYTLVTYYEEGSGQNKKVGFYVLDFPNLSVAPKSWFVGAADYPFNTQNPLFQNVVPDFSWNSPGFRNGSTGGGLTKWELNGAGTGYTQVLLASDSVTNLLASGSGSSGAIYAVMLFRDGLPENFFFGGMSSGTLPANIANLPDLPVTMNAGCTSFVIDFSNLGLAAEYKGNTPGTDNGYARTSDGKCGAWDKTSSSNNHTPGATNGSASGLAGSLQVAVSATCGQALGDPFQRVTFNILGFDGSVSFLEDFPIKVTMYYDQNHNGILDGGDIPHNTVAKEVTDTAVATSDTFHLKEDVPTQGPSYDLIFAFRTKRGCFDRIVAISLACSPLPVNLTSFNAVRTSSSTVKLEWETAMEEKNKGFAVQRMIGTGNWQIIGFIDSKAANGNSSSPLNYEFTDLNSSKGVTQYRLKQIDIDYKATFSQIRAVRGEGQVKGKTIVYPNPSSNGQVNIVFEDKNAVRDIVVLDMSGRAVKQFRAVSNNNIQIENLNAGMYTVRIVNIETGDQDVQKFVVNKR